MKYYAQSIKSNLSTFFVKDAFKCFVVNVLLNIWNTNFVIVELNKFSMKLAK